MIQIRVKTKISKEELNQKVGKMLTHEDYNLLITKDTKVFFPSGVLGAIYLKECIPEELADNSYEVLHELKKQQTNNRGYASGTPRVERGYGKRTETARAVASAIIGSFDPMGAQQFCRLTAFSGKEFDKYKSLFPLFEYIGERMKEEAPDRYNAQMDFVNNTHEDWVIPNTPFTTITVNNTYATGVHTDKGDLDEGISTLACIKKGDCGGGYLVLPEYRIAFNMGDRDLLIFDAHQWHGNTPIEKNSEDAERISIVSYYRTKMEDCNSMEEENKKRIEYAESRITK